MPDVLRLGGELKARSLLLLLQVQEPIKLETNSNYAINLVEATRRVSLSCRDFATIALVLLLGF